jgi:phage tail P2-like protein
MSVPSNILRSYAQSIIAPLAPPLPEGGQFDAYAFRHVVGVGGKGRNVPGVVAFPDPYDRAQDPVSPAKTLFELRNVPLYLFDVDPAGLLRFFLEIAGRERLAWASVSTSLVEIFDPDRCPEVLLPYLARQVGARVDKSFGVQRVREQIKSAIPRYKEKGLVSGFARVFQALGFDAEIRHVYLSPPQAYRLTLLQSKFAAAGISYTEYAKGDTFAWPYGHAYGDYPPGFDDGLAVPTNYIDLRLSKVINDGDQYVVDQDDSPILDPDATVPESDPTYYRRDINSQERTILDFDAYL